MRMRDVRRPSPSNEQVARGGAFRPHSSPRAREKQARTASGLINAPSISRGGAKIRVCRAQDPRTAAAPPLIGVMCNQLSFYNRVPCGGGGGGWNRGNCEGMRMRMRCLLGANARASGWRSLGRSTGRSKLICFEFYIIPCSTMLHELAGDFFHSKE
jgi:hypothetical protein